MRLLEPGIPENQGFIGGTEEGQGQGRSCKVRLGSPYLSKAKTSPSELVHSRRKMATG